MWDFLRFFNPRALRKGVVVEETPDKANENLLKFVYDHYKCHQIELFTEAKKPRGKFAKKFKKFAKSKKGEWVDEISPKLCLMVILCIQCSLHDVNNHIMLYTRFTPWLAIILCTLLYTFVSMPIYMAFFFLSNYTRNSYVKFWLVAPIFKGLSFSVAILNSFSCILNMTLVSLYILFMFALFTDGLECGYLGNECVFRRYNAGVCLEPGMGMPKVGTYVFLKYILTSKFGDSINNYWVVTVFLLYFLVTICVVYAKIAFGILCRIIGYIFGCMLVAIAIYELTFGTKYTIMAKTSGDVTDVLKAMFWVSCGRATLRRTLPGDLITYGSMTIAGVSPITMGILMAVMRIAFTSTIVNIYAIALNSFVENRGVQNTDCLEITGLTVLFCILPDQIMHWKMSTICLFIYFMFAIIMGTMSNYLSFNSFLRAFADENSDTRRNRTNIVIILCIIICGVNIVVVGYGFEYLIMAEFKMFLPPLLTYVCIGFFIASYSPLRICSDFYFACGRKLHSFWSFTMKLNILFVMSIFILYIVFEMPKLQSESALTIDFAGLTFVVLPIVVFGALRLYIAKKQKIPVVAPDKMWGAPDKSMRLERQAFDPKREFRIKRNLPCKHECLVQSPLLKHFMFETQDNFKRLQQQYVGQLTRTPCMRKQD